MVLMEIFQVVKQYNTPPVSTTKGSNGGVGSQILQWCGGGGGGGVIIRLIMDN